jgi:TP901 family phage tail tape measure protein
MPENAGTIYSEVRIRLDKINSDIKAVNTRLDKFAVSNKQNSEKVSKSWTKSFQNINLAGVAAFTAIGLAVKQSITIFAEFEQSMANVQSVSGATAEEFEKLEQAAINAGETTRFTATEAADAMYYLASAGLDAEQSISALDGVLQLAGATGSDLANTSAIMAATLSQFSLEAEESGRVSNVFAAAIANSQANMEKLGSALKQVGPISGALGISLEETTASLQALYNAGFAGEQAGTGLRNILLELADSSGPVIQQLEKVGIAFEDVNPREVGLTGAIDELAESGVDLGTIFGKRVAAQILTLAKTGGDALRELQAEVTNTQKATELYAIQNDTLSGSIDFLNSALESAQIKIGEELAPALKSIVDFLTFLVSGFNQLPGPVKLAVGVFAIGIPVVTGLAAAFTALGAAVGTFAGPVAIAVGTIAALAGVIAGVNQGLEDYENRFIDAADATEEQRLKLDGLLREYETLKGEADTNTEAQTRLKEVIQELAQIVPEAVTEFDEYGKALEINSQKISDNIQALAEEEIVLLELQEEELKARQKAAEEALSEHSAYLRRLDEEIAKQEEIIEIVNKRTDLDILTRANALDAAESRIKLLQQELTYARGQQEQTKFIEQQTQAQEELVKVQERLNFLRIQADPVLRKQYEEEQARLKAEEEERKRQEKLAAELAERERQRLLELQKLEEEYAERREDFRRANLSEEQRAIEDLNVLRQEYIEAGLETEEWYQNELQKIKEKYRDKDKEKNAEEQAEREKAATEKLIEIRSQYQQKLEDIGKTNEELIEIERRRAIEEIESSEASLEAKRQAVQAVNEYYDALKDDTANQQFIQNLTSVKDAAINTFNGMLGALSTIYQATTQERLDQLDRQLQAELDAAGLLEQTEIERLQTELQAAKEAGDKETANQLEQDIQRLQIEQEYERERARIKYKGELQQWRITLSQSIATAAQAILSGYATQPFIPLGIIAGVLATALSAVQLGAVLKAKPKPPAFQTGGIVVPGGSEGKEVTVAENGSPELLLNGGREGIPFMTQFAEAVADIIISKTENGEGSFILQLNVDGKIVAESSAKYYNNGIVKLSV